MKISFKINDLRYCFAYGRGILCGDITILKIYTVGYTLEYKGKEQRNHATIQKERRVDEEGT
jgi:hypothetical protein